MGREKMGSTDAVANIYREELVADALTASVYQHVVVTEIGPRQAWSYVTDGLSKLGQSELLLTILVTDFEESTQFPLEPLRYFKQMYQQAVNESYVEAGDVTEFSTQSIFAPHFRGLLYLPAPRSAAVPTRSPLLAVVPITAEEILVCKTCGSARTAAKLTALGRHYPYSTWCDRQRKSVFSETDLNKMASEHLASLPVATAFYASVMCHELVCSLLVSFENSHTLADLFDEVPPLSPLVISTAIDPRANAALVWDPNQSGARSAVGPEASDASRLSGCHLAILPGLSKVECGYYLDGFVLMLGATDWQAMKDALRQDRGYTIECGGAFKQFLIARS